MKQMLLIALLWFSAAPITEAGSDRGASDFISEPTLPEGQTLLVYPNPAPSGQFKIAYHLPHVHELTIRLYNVIGKEVKKFIVSLTDEKGTIEVDARTVSDGMYYVDIQASGYRHLEKIIVW